jgi:hypothetical protein
MALTAASALTANDRRNLLIAQRRADDVHSGSRRNFDELSLVRKGQVPFKKNHPFRQWQQPQPASLRQLLRCWISTPHMSSLSHTRSFGRKPKVDEAA